MCGYIFDMAEKTTPKAKPAKYPQTQNCSAVKLNIPSHYPRGSYTWPKISKLYKHSCIFANSMRPV